jgi:hypothetical protein
MQLLLVVDMKQLNRCLLSSNETWCKDMRCIHQLGGGLQNSTSTTRARMEMQSHIETYHTSKNMC